MAYSERSLLSQKVTVAQIENMKHAIGYEGCKVRGLKHHTYTPYRNHYTTPGVHEGWQSLCDMGLAGVRSSEGIAGRIGRIYWVTDKGMIFLSRLFDVKILKEEK